MVRKSENPLRNNDPGAEAARSRTEKAFKEAMELRRNGFLRKSIEILSDLVQSNPRNPSIRWILGETQRENGSPREAIDTLLPLVKSHPKSERPSIGLFLALWDAGDHDDALSEMRRFLCLANSEEYNRILRDLLGRDKIDTTADLDQLGDAVSELSEEPPGRQGSNG